MDEDGKEELVEEEEGREQEGAVLPILFLGSGSAPGTRPGTDLVFFHCGQVFFTLKAPQ